MAPKARRPPESARSSSVSSARRPSLLRRIGAWLVRASGVFPLTWFGILVAAGSAFVLFHYGLARIDLVLLVVGAVGLAVAALGLLFGVVAALVVYRKVRKHRPGEPLRLECGYWAESGFSLPSFWYLPFVHVSWRWSRPDAEVRLVRRKGRVVEQVRPMARSTAAGIERRFEIGDIFGVTRVTFRQREERPVRFLPWVGGLKQMHVVRGMSGGDELSHPDGPPEGDRYDMRRYAPGDPVRYVLWKVFAKSRQLLIRTPEQAVSPARQTLAYLVSSDGDEAAAGAARVAVDMGALGKDWKLGADGCGEVADNKEQALDLLVRSAGASKEQSGAGLGEFLSQASRGTGGRAIVFVPPRPGAWLDRIVKATSGAGKRAGRVEVIVGTDGVDRARKRSWLARVAFGPKREPEGSLPARSSEQELATVVKALSGAKVNVLVVDRAAGQVYSQQHLSSLRS